MKKILFRNSLITKVLLSYIICLILSVSIVTIYNFNTVREKTIKDLNDNAYSQVEKLTFKCDRLFYWTEQLCYDLACILSDLGSKLSDKDKQELMLDNLIWNQTIKNITIAYLEDKDKSSDFKSVKVSLDPNLKIPLNRLTWENFPVDCPFAVLTHANFCKESWFSKAIEKENLDGKWFGQYFSERLITYTYPFYRYEGKKEILNGVIKVDLKLEWLIKITTEVKVYEGGYCTFLSSDGYMLGKNGEITNMFEYADKTNNPSIKETLKKIMVDEPTFERYYNNALEDWFLILTYPASEDQWWFGVVVPEEEYFEDMLERLTRLIIVGIVCLLIPIPLIVFFIFRQTKHLSNLTKAANQIGGGNFDAELLPITANDEIGILNNTFIKMKEDIKDYIENVRLMTESKQQVENELRIAKSIQNSIIPHNFPDVNEFEFKAFILPAKTVGGDFYDFFFIDQDHFCFMLGDVSGKSISGAIFMAIARTMIRSNLLSGLSLANALNLTNKNICAENSSGMFLTLFIAVLDIRNGQIQFINAGHCPPAIRKVKSFIYLVPEKVMPAIGMIDFTYIAGTLSLMHEDELFLYTDGVTESQDINLNFLGEDKLLENLNANIGCQINETLTKIYQTVTCHQGESEQSDDICMAILKYKGV
ncbi:MAG TPA: hypothetical protein DD381_14245 [Lentisphaeria bacterium]|nr:MAG: hypothetical protein A2X47_01020 [Lentisphaerae bacterium GWF2_38_69]HBM17485.1 hypothetical protein [Lentisphaeria bacterium]